MNSKTCIKRIRSGGQSGVDRAALDFAKVNNIPIVGWCPKDGWAEDMHEAPGVMKLYPELRETPSAVVDQRTVWNVRDADATLVISGNSKSNGTDLTAATAKNMNKPYLICDLNDSTNNAVQWLRGLNSNIELNIGGPRESEEPGAYKKSYEFLENLLQTLSAEQAV